MAKHGKNYNKKMEMLDRRQRYEIDDAVKLLKQVSYTKFDSSVDFAINLGVNPRHADQMVRGTVSLPHGTGKEVKVLVFAKGEKAIEAKEAGADFVGAEDLVEKIKEENWVDFDKAVATPDMMRVVGKIGRILGTRGLMPNPKVGTVTFDVGQTVKDLKKGKIDFRVEKAGIIHVAVGKISFDEKQLRENILAVVDILKKMRPATAKGVYFKSMTISPTMGPGIKLDIPKVLLALLD
ncbi:MAG: 50S ribosomal protein L1 [Deltaproteobacteria bacterium]|jgi:large subunit ribosomal protein L1|nr:50S ribosomal protein L1 [Deltaproteobacteria bacterium]